MKRQFSKVIFHPLKRWRCIVFFTLVAANGIFADTLGLDARTEDNLNAVQNVFYSADPGLFLYGRANFCINTNLPSFGTFRFKYVITDPDGNRVHDKESEPQPVPSVPQYLEMRDYVLPMAIFKRSGNYTLVVSFIEYYPSTNTSLSVNRTYSFSIRSGSRPGVELTRTNLLQPLNNALNIGPNPFFLWTPLRAGVKYNLYLSRYDDPESNILWKKEGLSETAFIYTGEYPLEINQRYYWMIKAVDNSGTPVGLYNGNSLIYSFTTGDIGETPTIQLLYPRNEEIGNSLPVFKWSSAFGKNSPVDYELMVAKDFPENLIWIANTKSVMYQYPAAAPALNKGDKYFWFVIGRDIKQNEAKKSQIANFRYEPVIQNVKVEWREDRTSVSGLVMNYRKIGLPDTAVYFKEIITPGAIPKEYTALTGEAGKFTLKERVKPGKYRIFAEKLMGDIYNTLDLEVEIQPDIDNSFVWLMKNNLGVLSLTIVDNNGMTVSDASITLRNAQYTWKQKSDGRGLATFYLADGKYTVEVTKSPGYSRYKNNNLAVSGAKEQQIILPKAISGAARIQLLEGGTNATLENIQVDGTFVSP